MSEVFISYSRKDKGFVRRLGDELAARHREAWIDWKDIPLTAEWQREIFTNIETADNFVFVISPDSIASPNCKKEIDHAAANNKRIAPIFYRFVPDDAIPETLAKYQRIDFVDDVDFSSKFEMLVKALDTDLVWTQAHTRLLTRAKEWEHEAEDGSFLLRGKDLDEAETWMARSAEREPKPTPLQSRYILASRQASTKRQRIVIAAVVTALVVSLGLAVYAFRQKAVANQNAVEARRQQDVAVKNEHEAKHQQGIAEQQTHLADERRVEAEKQTRIALSRALGTAALLKQDRELDLASLLGSEALRMEDTFEARNAVFSAYQGNPRLMTCLHHPAFVNSVAFSADGRSLATLDENGMVRLWDIATRQVIWQDKETAVRELALSPVGNLLAAHRRNGSVAVWNIAKRILVGTISAPRTVNNLAFSRDGKLLAFSKSDGFVELWNALSLEKLGEPIQVSEGGMGKIVFSPDGTSLAVYRTEGPIVLNLVTKKVQTAKKTIISDLAFSTDGKVLAASSPTSGVVQLWEVPSLNFIEEAGVPHGGASTTLTYNTNGKLFAVGLYNGTVQLFDATDRHPVAEPLQGHSGRVTSVAFSPDGKVLASSAQDRTVLIWNVTYPRIIASEFQEHFEERVGAPQALAFSSDNKRLASAGFDSTLRLWNVASRKQIGSSAHLDPRTRPGRGDSGLFAFTADMRLLAAVKSDGEVHLWDVATMQPVPGLSVHPHEHPIALAFSTNGEILASAFSEGRIQFWKIHSGKPGNVLVNSRNELEIKSLVFSRNDKLLAAADENGDVQLWDVEHQRPVGGVLKNGSLAASNLLVTGQLSNVAFSRDGRILATGSKDGSVSFWDVATRKLIGEPLIDELGKEISSVVFSPDGKLLATGGEDTVRLWDVGSRQAMGKPLQTGASVLSMAFSTTVL